MDDTHTALSITIADPEQQPIGELLEHTAEFDTEVEDIDGVELHIPRISGENAITLLETVLSDGYDPAVTEMVVEVRQ